MGRHSKHNTASGHFTYAEYQMLSDRWGTQRTRLGLESVRRFDSCCLCLQPARNPVCCDQGHVFCKECILQDLLTQKQSIQRFKKQLESWQKEEESEREAKVKLARDRVLKDFDAVQARLAGSPDEYHAPKMTGAFKRKASSPPGNGTDSSSLSSSFHTRAHHLAAEAERAALQTLEAEHREARRAKLPAFWLPSLTPSEAEAPPKVVSAKLKTLCKAGDERGHRISIKALIPLHFTTLSEGADPNATDKICAGCKKRLTSSSVLFALKPCGHVHCQTCVTTLVLPADVPACVQCDTALPLSVPVPSGDAAGPAATGRGTASVDAAKVERKREGGGRTVAEGQVVQLQREGTGFAAGGVSVVVKKGTAFQG